MKTIRLHRGPAELADVPEGTKDEAALRKLGFEDFSEHSSAPPPGASVESDEIETWPLKTPPAEYLEQREDEDPATWSDVVRERVDLARRIVAAAAG